MRVRQTSQQNYNLRIVDVHVDALLFNALRKDYEGPYKLVWQFATIAIDSPVLTLFSSFKVSVLSTESISEVFPLSVKIHVDHLIANSDELQVMSINCVCSVFVAEFLQGHR